MLIDTLVPDIDIDHHQSRYPERYSSSYDAVDMIGLNINKAVHHAFIYKIAILKNNFLVVSS